MPDDNVTKKDLTEMTETLLGRMDGFAGRIDGLRGHMEARFIEVQKNVTGHMDENFATKHELAATEERLEEKIHDTETRILRGYESHARAVEAHLKTLDGQSAANFWHKWDSANVCLH